MTINSNKAKDIAEVGLMVAMLEAAKLALGSLPNIELVTFLIIVFTLYFGKRTLFAVPAFILIEVMIFGFNPLWVIAYCYVWPLLCLVTLLFKNRPKSAFAPALLSGFFGLFFGFLCSFPYLFITTGTNPDASLASAIAWWIAGIPFDIIHGTSNFIIMLVLYTPVCRVMDKALKYQRQRAD